MLWSQTSPEVEIKIKLRENWMLALRSLKPVINRKLITRQESVRRKCKKDKTNQQQQNLWRGGTWVPKRSCDSAQQIPCFDSSQLTIIWIIKLNTGYRGPILGTKCNISHWFPCGVDGEKDKGSFLVLWTGTITKDLIAINDVISGISLKTGEHCVRKQ